MKEKAKRFHAHHVLGFDPAGDYPPIPEGTHTIVPTPCRKAGHLGVRTATGRCVYCEQEKTLSARQRAIAAGEDWYTPDKPCRKCGTTAPRRVNNGECQGCKPERVTVRVSLPRELSDRLDPADIEPALRWFYGLE